MNEHEDYLSGPEMDGAVLGVRFAMNRLGIGMNDETATAIAVSVLSGFANAGGLEPKSVEYVRRIVAEVVKEGSH